MEAVQRLYVDSNIFIRLFEGNDEIATALAELFLLETKRPEQPLATSELTLAEVLVVPYREQNDRLIDAYDGWTKSNDYLEVGPLDRGVLWYAALLRSQYQSLKLPDAIHVSTAIGMRCSHFLSADRRLADRYELTHTRHGVTKGPASVEVVHPERDVVDQLIRALSQ